MIIPKLDNSAKILANYIQRQRENKKISRSVEMSFTFMLIIFFLATAIRPTFVAISSLLGEIKAKEILTKSLETRINQIIKAQESYAQVQTKYQIIDAALPENPHFYFVNNQIQQNAARNEVDGTDKLTYVINQENRDSPNSVHKKAKEFSLDLSLAAPIKSLNSFITNLLNNRRALIIPEIKIGLQKTNQPENEISPQNNVTYNLKSVFYYWQP